MYLWTFICVLFFPMNVHSALCGRPNVSFLCLMNIQVLMYGRSKCHLCWRVNIQSYAYGRSNASSPLQWVLKGFFVKAQMCSLSAHWTFKWSGLGIQVRKLFQNERPDPCWWTFNSSIFLCLNVQLMTVERSWVWTVHGLNAHWPTWAFNNVTVYLQHYICHIVLPSKCSVYPLLNLPLSAAGWKYHPTPHWPFIVWSMNAHMCEHSLVLCDRSWTSFHRILLHCHQMYYKWWL